MEQPKPGQSHWRTILAIDSLPKFLRRPRNLAIFGVLYSGLIIAAIYVSASRYLFEFIAICKKKWYALSCFLLLINEDYRLERTWRKQNETIILKRIGNSRNEVGSSCQSDIADHFEIEFNVDLPLRNRINGLCIVRSSALGRTARERWEREGNVNAARQQSTSLSTALQEVKSVA